MIFDFPSNENVRSITYTLIDRIAHLPENSETYKYVRVAVESGGCIESEMKKIRGIGL